MTKVDDILDDKLITIKLPRRQLTTKQRQYIEFIETYYKENGKLPTYQTIADFFGVVRSTVHEALNRKGFKYSSRTGIMISE